MIEANKIAETLRQCAQEVFTTMLGMEIEAGPTRIEQAAPAVSDGVLAFVGMAGAWAGSGVISCSAGLARQICAALLLTEPAAVDDDVLDAVAEVANMVIGNFKTMAEEILGPINLSIPTVIYGKNYESRTIGVMDWVVVPFRCNGEEMEIRACMAPAKQGRAASADGSIVMMRTEKVVEYVRTSTTSVFSTMLGLEVEHQDERVDREAPASSGGVLSFIGMAGSWAGTGVVCCTADFARRICAALLLTDSPSVDEDVLDAMGELTNMIIGNFKTMAEEHLGPLGLSIPTVIYGRNFVLRSAGHNDWIVVPFTCDGESIEIRVCLTPSKESATPHGGFTCPASALV
jgi:chemotaxis protein CheX